MVLLFIFHLEREFFNACEGCFTVPTLASSKTKAFFGNPKTKETFEGA
jgi:hypothetical protein